VSVLFLEKDLKKHEKVHLESVIIRLRIRPKAANRHIPVPLGLVSLVLLAVALGQCSRVHALTSTTKFAQLEEFGNTVAVRCMLGGTKRKKCMKSVHETYGSLASSSLLVCCCASELEGSGEGSRMSW
jgi:hypothetical protein